MQTCIEDDSSPLTWIRPNKYMGSAIIVLKDSILTGDNMKIKLDNNTKLLYYAEIKTASPTVHLLAHKHTEKKGPIELEETRLEIFFVYPSGKVNRQVATTDDFSISKIKDELVPAMMMLAEGLGENRTLVAEEELNHDSFEEMMSWLMTKPRLMKLIAD